MDLSVFYDRQFPLCFCNTRKRVHAHEPEKNIPRRKNNCNNSTNITLNFTTQGNLTFSETNFSILNLLNGKFQLTENKDNNAKKEISHLRTYLAKENFRFSLVTLSYPMAKFHVRKFLDRGNLDIEPRCPRDSQDFMQLFYSQPCPSQNSGGKSTRVTATLPPEPLICGY